MIPKLEIAIANMEDKPDFYKQYDSPNGCGIYDDFLPWLKKVLKFCKDNPDAEVEASI